MRSTRTASQPRRTVGPQFVGSGSRRWRCGAGSRWPRPSPGWKTRSGPQGERPRGRIVGEHGGDLAAFVAPQHAGRLHHLGASSALCRPKEGGSLPRLRAGRPAAPHRPAHQGCAARASTTPPRTATTRTTGSCEIHATLLRELSGALKAFLDDLAAAKLADRVVVLCFSEFGRRVRENGSSGTDHGTAGPVFLAGPKRAGRAGG